MSTPSGGGPTSTWLSLGAPAMTSQFQLVIDQVEIGFFLELSGLQLDVAVEEYQEGGQNAYVHKFPGRMTWPNLVLKRGMTNSDALFDWVNQSSGESFSANGNKLKRPTGAVTMFDHTGTPMRSWTLIEPFPIRWVGPRLSVKETTVAEEEIEIAHHGFRSKTFT